MTPPIAKNAMEGAPERITSNADAARRFAVILVNYNGFDTLLEAVRSVLADGVPQQQIVIVDNGSYDASLIQVEGEVPEAAVLRNGCNAGFARAVNRGIRARPSELYLLLNNDAQLEPGALAAFAEAFDAEPKLGIAGGQLHYPDGRLQSAFAPSPSLTEELVPVNFLKWINPERYVRSSTVNEIREVESVFGACLAVRASAADQVGLLDEDFFFYFEEVEWCRRMRLGGWKVSHVPLAAAMHVLGLTANRYRSEARIELQRSKLLYFRKCASPGSYCLLSGFLVVRTFINAFFGSLACLLTFGLQAKLRANTLAYWKMFAWHLFGRPRSWGLPGKCPAAAGADRPLV